MTTLKINKKKNKKMIFILILSILIMHTTTVFALTDNQIAEILAANKKFFVQNTLLEDTIRKIAWGLVQFLSWLLDGSISIYNQSLGIIDVTNSKEFTSWVASFKDIFTVLFTLCIFILGIILIVNHKKKPNLLISIMLIGICITALGSIISIANDATVSLASDIAGDTFSSDVINENFYDLLYIDKTKGLATMSSDAAYLAECHYPYNVDFSTIGINDTINYDSSSISTADGKTILSKKYDTYVSDNGLTPVVEDVYNGFGWNDGEDNDILNEFYYRYHVDYFPIYATYIAILLVYIAMSYKVFRLIYEIAFGRIVAVLYSADINSTQKTMKILASLRDSYIVIIFTSLLIKLFKLFQSYLSSKFLPDHQVSYSIFLLFLAFCVIDGPNLAQQLTGVDAGLSSSVGRLLALSRIGSMAGGIGKGALGFGINMADRHRQNNRHSELINAVKNNSKSNASSNLNSNLNSKSDSSNSSQSAAHMNNSNQSNTQTNNTGKNSNLNKANNTQNSNMKNSDSQNMKNQEDQNQNLRSNNSNNQDNRMNDNRNVSNNSHENSNVLSGSNEKQNSENSKDKGNSKNKHTKGNLPEGIRNPNFPNSIPKTPKEFNKENNPNKVQSKISSLKSQNSLKNKNLNGVSGSRPVNDYKGNIKNRPENSHRQSENLGTRSTPGLNRQPKINSSSVNKQGNTIHQQNNTGTSVQKSIRSSSAANRKNSNQHLDRLDNIKPKKGEKKE